MEYINIGAYVVCALLIITIVVFSVLYLREIQRAKYLLGIDTPAKIKSLLRVHIFVAVTVLMLIGVFALLDRI